MLFAICGDSGTGKTTLAKALASKLSNTLILECDRYHKWERNNPQWQHFTHLHPDANYIDLMNEDVRALKAGESIYRCSYDHQAGTFTPGDIIRPSGHIISCGLHTFMCPDSLYDLKIFMDTDEVLRTQWKIARDTTKRGYTTEEVKNQIDKRQHDYSMFIKPLMHDADIIVNFCNDDIPYIDSIKGIGRLLRLFIRDEYRIYDTLKRFEACGIEFDYIGDGRQGFQTIEIYNYKPIGTHYYYDYVVEAVCSITN